MGRRSAVAALFGALVIPGAGQAQTAPVTPALSVVVQTSRPGPTINRDIFGQFAEMLGEGIYGGVWVGKDSKIPHVRGIRTDVVQALRALKVPNVRWPGGCYADQYHWRDGVGSERRARVNVTWGGVIDPNSFGTHEFMDLVEQIGSEAFLSVNVGSGTVQEAADWLEYMTASHPTALAKERAANGRKAPWRVKYLGIGNESWGCGGNFTPESYVERMKPFSMFVKNMNPDQLAPAPSSGGQAGSPDSLALLAAMGEVPPQGMKRIAVGQGLGQRAYTEAVMKAWQTRMPFLWSVEGLSLHHYTHTAPYPMTDASFGFGEREYAQLLEKTYKMNDMIVEHSAIMDKYDPQKKVAIAIDEWGAWLKPLPNTPMMFLRQQNSLRDAVLASINLNIFARHADRVRMTNIAQMVNVIQSMILTDGPKMVLTPTYHVYRMYVPFQDATFIPITLEAGEYRSGSVRLPQVDAIAARAKDGKIWLALANLDPARPAELRLSGVDASAAVGEVLTGEAVSSINTFEAPQAVVPKPFSARTQGGILMLRLQPKSITVVQLQP